MCARVWDLFVNGKPGKGDSKDSFEVGSENSRHMVIGLAQAFCEHNHCSVIHIYYYFPIPKKTFIFALHRQRWCQNVRLGPD